MDTALKILFINGPNLNLLGTRQPEIYGAETLPDLMAAVQAYLHQKEVEIQTFQSNSEGDLITAVQKAPQWANGIVLNPGAYTHTSIAIRDAISAINIPVVECHLSNVHAREAFRHQSVISGVCLGVVAGFGRWSYFLAADALIHHLTQ